MATDAAPTAPPASLARDPCPSCGRRALGRFCHRCGERRVGSDDYSLRRFARETVPQIFDVDSRVFRSFGALLARPGHLTREHAAGRRRPYIPPVQLFLLCNVVFFLVEPLVGSQLLTTPLRYHLNMPHGDLARAMVAQELRETGLGEEQYRLLFDQAAATQARSLVIVMVPAFTLLVALAYARSHRYLVEHLVFSFHLYAWFLLFATALVPLLLGTTRLIGLLGMDPGPIVQQADLVASTVASLSVATYLYLAAGRAYGQAPWVRAAKAAALTVGMFLVLQLYRSILFFTVFHTL